MMAAIRGARFCMVLELTLMKMWEIVPYFNNANKNDRTHILGPLHLSKMHNKVPLGLNNYSATSSNFRFVAEAKIKSKNGNMTTSGFCKAASKPDMTNLQHQ